MSLIANDKPGQKLLLMGNEAIARGAIEAGVKVSTAYPGNPSSEIIGSLSQVGKDLGIYVEWSVNEKVALEVATAASFSGLRALTAMKQNGLNVASDFLFTMNLGGTIGGLVIVVCDDPSAHSSGNEEDTRSFSKIGDLPLFEPSTSQEAKEMTRYAFDLSEELKVPCLIRSVTRVSHARGNVQLGEILRERRIPQFDKSRPFLPYPAANYHKYLHNKLKQCQERFETSPFNFYRGSDEPELLIITSGACWMYTFEAMVTLNVNDRIGVVKLGTSWPLPWEFLQNHLRKTDRILFVEEVDPFLEDNIKAFYAQNVKELGIKTFLGKATGTIPDVGEMTPDIVIEAIQKILKITYDSRPAQYEQEANQAISLVPSRELGFCAGCPHRSTYWAIKNALSLDGQDGFVLGDVGCYTLGMTPSGYSQMKTFFCMGSGTGLANGFGQFDQFGFHQTVIAVCGDSTFFHAALPALVNAVYNQANFLMLILDNSATAMTGFQPHPGTGRTAMGANAPVISIEAVCQTLGARVEVQDPFDLQGTTETIYRLLNDTKGIKVLVLRQECALVRRKRQKASYAIRVDQDRCVGTECGCNRLCTRIFKCPGLIFDFSTGKAKIDEAICNGCGVCTDVCPQAALIKEDI